ncbi:hypothetical protein DNTS_022985 [Danionella cerebrum]|uniref:DH domain-containing protein n=1 Tax=Danionella cerebrum TaxID=2873325 RepID=A0A553RB65_9TELE|nr:hypothetical protein DNTS_022985 [Danionella translucida]
MSHRKSDGSVGDRSLLVPESRFSSALQLDPPSVRSASSINLSQLDSPEDEPRSVVLSTESEATKKLGTHQLIPKNLAVTSRPKIRHHTMVVTLPVPLQASDLSWEDYDSDAAEGFSLRRNRRNKSYRAAVTSLNLDAVPGELQTDTLTPGEEEKPVNQKPAAKAGRKVRVCPQRNSERHRAGVLQMFCASLSISERLSFQTHLSCVRRSLLCTTLLFLPNQISEEEAQLAPHAVTQALERWGGSGTGRTLLDRSKTCVKEFLRRNRVIDHWEKPSPHEAELPVLTPEPRFYQEIKERGLNASSLSTEDEDFTPAEPPGEDQGIVVKNYRAAYITWSQLPQVKDSGILEHISPEERKRQEAIFEIITSEFSYQHSLSILVRHFQESVELKSSMTVTEHHHLFSNISVILDVSKRYRQLLLFLLPRCSFQNLEGGSCEKFLQSRACWDSLVEQVYLLGTAQGSFGSGKSRRQGSLSSRLKLPFQCWTLAQVEPGVGSSPVSEAEGRLEPAERASSDDLWIPHSRSLLIFLRFFEDLDRRHQKNPVIRDISDIVQNYASQHFKPYIVYCSNETFQQRTLQKLLSSNAAFREALKPIESSEECGGLPMLSFLILPMQRVTRLPLLMDTICQKSPKETAEYFAACWAFKAISKVRRLLKFCSNNSCTLSINHRKPGVCLLCLSEIASPRVALVKSCNDGARRMERTEQMYTIQKQMDFGKIKPFPLVSSSRWLRKNGELAVYTEDLSIFRKAFSFKSYFLFLFNDVLIVTKKRSEESYVVQDYATVEKVDVEEDGGEARLNLKLLMNASSEGRGDQLVLVAESRLDRARWVTALRDVKHSSSVASDDLPQYEATKAYMPKAPDELSLQQAELVIVLQQEEGWCYGERMRDGERGWFPASCATQITNRMAMENNIQQMERLRKETNV